MRPPRSFKPDFWRADIALMPEADQHLAQHLFDYATGPLGGQPYYRNSRGEISSDRQVMIKHPVAGVVCLMISVVPNPAAEKAYHPRIEFFDQPRALTFPGGTITDGPGDQFARKGERRMLVSPAMDRSALEAFLARIFDRER